MSLSQKIRLKVGSILELIVHGKFDCGNGENECAIPKGKWFYAVNECLYQVWDF